MIKDFIDFVYNTPMDEERTNTGNSPMDELITYIRNTYSGSTTQEVAKSEQRITALLEQNPANLLNLFEYLTPPFSGDLQFRQSVSICIKKHYFKLASDSQLDKRDYVIMVYKTLLLNNYQNHRIKEFLGNALEYILNKDEKLLLKNQIFKDAVMKMQSLVAKPEQWSIQATEEIHGIGIALIAYMNSLVQPEQLVEFMRAVLQPLTQAASICLHFAINNISSSVPQQVLFLGSQKVLQIIEIGMERLLEEEDLLPNQIQSIKNSELLNNIIMQYLHAEGIEESIISPYSSLNQIKQSIMGILYLLNTYQTLLPKPTINIILYTFLAESQKKKMQKRFEEDDDYIDQILTRCMEILESNLENKNYYSLFLEYKIQILFALLMYCRTGPIEEQNLYEEPEKFHELAQEFSECFSKSTELKVRGANFLSTFVRNIDEGTKNILELIIVFVTSSLCAAGSENQILLKFKQELGSYDFWEVTNRQKLDVSFSVLTVLAPHVFKHLQSIEIVYAVLTSQARVFCQMNDDLLVARLIRLVGYYPQAIYFDYIQNKMRQSRTFLLEGSKSFERIMKNQDYVRTFPLMNKVMLSVIDLIDVSDSVFEQLVINSYGQILCKDSTLYMKAIDLLKQTFLKAAMDGMGVNSKHQAILCLNYLDKLIRRQRNEKYNQYLMSALEEMEVGRDHEILQDNFISIYHTITNKYLVLDSRVGMFALYFSQPSKLANLNEYSQFFLLLNKFILKNDNYQLIKTINQNLQNFLQESMNPHFNRKILCHLCFVIGQILVSDSGVQINQGLVNFVFNWVIKLPKEEGYDWIMFLSLHYAYLKPAQIRQYLLSHDVYFSYMIKIFQAKFQTKLQRKVAVLALQEMLNYEQDQSLRKEVVKCSIRLLVAQKQKYRTAEKASIRKRQKTDATMRRMLNMNFHEQDKNMEERRENEMGEKDKNKVFEGLKHPFDRFDEFQLFKVKIKSGDWSKSVDPADIQALQSIIQAEWHKEKVRKIVKVHHPGANS